MPLVDTVKWRARKEALRRRLEEDLEIGYLDKDIVDILLKLFDFEGLYTISSCSGRITLIDGHLPWWRRNSTVVFKKHHPMTVDELMKNLEMPTADRLWLVVSGPIIHVSAADLRSSYELLKIARDSGMKHSGILSVNREKGVIIELRTGVRLTHLLKIKDQVLIDLSKAEELVNVANEALLDGKERLERLRRSLGIARS